MATTTLAPPALPKARTRAARARRRRSWIGWAFVAPFMIIFAIFLVAPLVYAFYLSLFKKALIGGTQFVLFDNYLKAFTDEHFLNGVWFVVKFSLVLIPLQMIVSLAIALILDAVTTRFTRFSRLMVFLPYAIPAVIGALMWGFLYSKNFGPLTQLFGLIGQTAPDFLSPDLIFFGLLNVVTWQWAGYYMIILYAALQGIDPTIYEAARIDGANAWQIAVRIKVPMITNSLVLILVFALIGTLQFFNEPTMLKFLAAGSIGPDFTPNMYAYQQAFALANFNYGSAISFALGIVVFICVYIFLIATRKRGGFLFMTTGTTAPTETTGATEGLAPNGYRRARKPRHYTAHIVLGLLLVYFLVPFYWIIVNSSKDAAGLFGGGSALWFSDTIDYIGNLRDLFTYNGGIYLQWLGNSAFYALTGGVGATILAVLAGYGFAKFTFRGREFTFAVLLGSVMVPLTALVIPTFIMLSQFHLTNTVWAVILPSLLNPFGVYLMTVFARDAVPDELLDAARVDGAGEARIFFQVAVPLMRPAIVTVLLLSIVATWNNFFLPLAMLQNNRLFPVTVGINQWQSLAAANNGGGTSLWSLIIIGSLVSIVPLVIAFLSLQRYWQGGLAIGSLK